MNLCLALASLLFLSPQNDKVEDQIKPFKGNVKTFTYYSCLLENKEKVDIDPDSLELEKITSTHYNKNGNRVIWYTYNNNEIAYEYKYVYDEIGNLIKETYYNHLYKTSSTQTRKYNKNLKEVERCIYDNKNLLDSKTQWIYNNNGTVDKMIIFGDERKTTWAFEYDSLGRKTKYLTYLNDSLIRKEFWDYDSLNNIVKFSMYSGDELLRMSNYKYDFSGNKLESIRVSKKGLDSWTKEEREMVNGVKTKKKIFLDNNGEVKFWNYEAIDTIINERVSISYNKHNQIVKRSLSRTTKGGLSISTVHIDSTSNLDFATFSEYNDKGDVIVSFATYSNDNSTYAWRYVYEYDSKNNWIKKVSYRNGTLYLIEKREFEYFED